MKENDEIGLSVSMKLGLVVGFCYIMRDAIALILTSFPYIVMITSIILFILPIRELYRTLKWQFEKSVLNNDRSNFMDYMQLFSTGALSFFFGGMVYALFLYIDTTYIDPQHLKNAIDLLCETMQGDETEILRAELNKITPSALIGASIMTFSLWGSVLSFVAVLFLRLKYRR